MSTIRDLFARYTSLVRRTIPNSKKLKEWSEQLYSPKEIRALLLFVGLGIAVLVWRSSNYFYRQFYPSSVPRSYAVERARTDSLFLALSAKGKSEDSLIFALPEDSLLPVRERSRTLHTKGSLLPPHSIALNTAPKSELVQLPGIGEATADLILKYRQERGRFRSVNELRNVRSIGPKKFERMRSYLRLE